MSNVNDKLFENLNIKRYNLHLQVADNIEKLIKSKKIKSNTFLPSERELSAKLGINRATLREAIRLLEQKGILKMISGRGIMVTDVPSSVVTDSIKTYYNYGIASLSDLLTVREMIEPEVAALAAKNAKEEDINKLKAIISKISKCVIRKDIKSYILEDVIFHETLAESTHNELIIAIIKGLRGISVPFRVKTIEKISLKDKINNLKVFEAVSKKEPILAREAMKEHMKTTRLAYHLKKRN